MKKSNWLLLVLALVLSMFLAACSTGGDSEGSEGSDSEGGEGTAEEGGESTEQVLNLINGDEIPSMDPSMATDTYAFEFLGATMEGLYRLGEGGKPVPGIAKDHTVSDDALTWTFNLRDDAVWSNGDPVTANDFVYAWQRAVDPATGSEYGPYMMGGVIKNATAVNKGEVPVDQLGVTAKDDHTLVVELEKPVPYFESLTTFGTFLPLNQAFVEEQGDAFATDMDKLVYNGPFKFTEWNPGDGDWTLEKNPDYWDAETVKLEKMNFKVVKDTATGINAYETGEVDRAGLSADFVDQYSTHEDYKIQEETTVFWLKFNQVWKDGPSNGALANENIRRAISMAFDKQALAETILNNGSIPATGVVPLNFAPHPETGEDFRKINGDLVTSDVEAAKEAWQKGLEELGVDSLTVEFLGDDSDTAKNMNAYLKNQLETNLEGLTVELKEVPFEQRLDLDTNMTYEIEFAGWGPDYLDPNTWLNLWETGGGNNMMGYSNPEYDALLKKANNELALKPVERFETFLEMEKILLEEDAAVAPVYQRARALLVKPYVKGILKNPFGPDYEYKWAYKGEE
ncbi:peptide ABC transporter substrate-binding protein [Radiobacillus kanasensis]|uniref:peptide ABC transporter substrate-binding protein n=1 Tax=Radiobacillus kanasensis TaxID=2844358 RepID=UPI001E32F1CE|nr:peptide ABC transporter substrate-binding protein [Radiobacillus kanasensis]UFU00566.1 peptide ABC transporter substrate-binding protein [Radiobacillus kanasensis]